MNNAQMAIFLMQSLGIPAPPCTSAPYADIPCSYWAAPWIAEGARRQINRSCDGHGNFCPNTIVTRAKMAGLIARAFDIPVKTAPNTQRNLQLTYNQGLLTGVSANGVSYGTLSYHPNLLVSQISHGNGVTETQTNDPNDMRRPSALAATGPYASWSSGTYSYDAAGNLTGWNGALYQYDRFNQMIRMASGAEDWTYLYTADDERIWSYSPSLSRWTLRDLDGKVLREYLTDSRGWSVGTDYLYRDGLLMAAETQTGRRHFHLDHLGTPRLITRGSGDRAAYHAYYPFGEEATAFNQDSERMKFTGHERDLGSAGGAGDDLDYMHARHCSPVTGRFLSTDSIMSANPKNPQSWNKLSYSLGNPLRFIDPNGRTVKSALGLIEALAPAIVYASQVTSGRVTPLEIAAILFQENRNDLNWIKGVDASSFLAYIAGGGGPEWKNNLVQIGFSLGLMHGSLGVGEMSTRTAAELFGWNPDTLTDDQKTQLGALLNDPITAVILTALYLDKLKQENPDASIVGLGSAYNSGNFNSITDVGRRSGFYLDEIQDALSSGIASGSRVVRCNGGYHFERQCQ